LILNRDRRGDTLACLDSLLARPYPNLDPVVLDNASSDGTAAAVRAAYPQVQVIETGGKQHRVTPGQVIEVDRLPQAKGSEITLGRVLMVVDGEQVTTGTPVVAGVRVAATVLAHPRGRKVIVGKFRSKKRYRRRVGHRQPLSRVRVDRIDVEGASRGA